MNILLTGNGGRLGPSIERQLVADGHRVFGFDLASGDDVMNAPAVAKAASAAECIVHVAGLAGDRGRLPADVMAVNLVGTSNVLLAAEAAGIKRLIHMSSGRSLGILERKPDYLPMDDDHRGLPSVPYALSKWLSEEMCAAFTQRTAIETVCLRPVQVFDDPEYERALQAPAKEALPGMPWHLATHLHVEDLAVAVAAAVSRPVPKHLRLLLCAPDVADRRPTLELVEKFLPDVPWRDRRPYVDDRYRALIDTRRAQELLGWTPLHRWPGRKAADARALG